MDGRHWTAYMKIQHDVIGTITCGFSREKHPEDAPPSVWCSQELHLDKTKEQRTQIKNLVEH